ncbi:MAG: polysaccharide biosynthesis protein [Candidatus Omnitrophica bacterium]|nr:polysaccharide biosynthesis protein [Candidatus Omnitrophota bacterium]
MINYKDLVKKVTVVGITDLFVRLKAFILIPIITKTFGAGPYGAWTQVMVTVNMLLPLVMLGMQHGFLRYLPGAGKEQAREDVSSIIIIVSITSLLGALFMFLISDFISIKFAGTKELSYLIKLGGIYLFTQSLRDLLLNYLRAREKVFSYSILVFIDAGLSIALSLIIVYLGYGIGIILWSFILLNMFLIAVPLLRMNSEEMLLFPSFSNTRKYLRYSLPFLPLIWLLWISNSSDRYFIGYFMNIRDVGIYSVCYSMSYFMINVISGPICLVFLPIITRVWNNQNRGPAVALINNLIKYTLFLTIPGAVFFFIVSKAAISIVASSEFIPGNVIIPFILLAYLCYIVAICIEPVIYLSDKSSRLVWIYLAGAGLNIVLNIIFIPVMGILGAAVSTMCSFAMQLLITYLTVLKENILKMDFKFLAKNLISALIAGVIVSYIPQTKFLSIALVFVSGMSLYILVSFLLKTFKKTDLELIKRILPDISHIYPLLNFWRARSPV